MPADPAQPVLRVVGAPASRPCAAAGEPPLRVTVVGADPELRGRLVDALAATPEVEVVGWADSVQASAVLDGSAELALVLHDGPRVDEVRRPRVLLSDRQVEVLVAYSATNDLLGVVARGLEMSRETLKTHLRRIRDKYAEAGRPAPTRRDLYVRAVEDGFLSPPLPPSPPAASVGDGG